jgi:putative acetyltransferase
VNIREAKNSDSREIKKLVFSVLNEYGLLSDPDNTDKDLDDIEGFYNNNGGFFGVVEEIHVIAATVGIIKIDSSTCELRKMYLSPNQRGKGLGKKLLEFSLSKAKELKFDRMILETAGSLKEAISLYKKYGFSEYKPNHLSERCDQAFELYIT